VRFNNCDGPRIVEDLLAHRDLWEGALMDTHANMVHLRDLPDNIWNVSRLYVVTKDRASAERMARLAEEWQADTVDILYESAADNLLGGSIEDEHCIVEVWWD
jgi:hypothetical protein